MERNSRVDGSRMTRRRFLGVSATAGFGLALLQGCGSGSEQSSGSEQGSAENYPRGPVELVAPYSEGGGTDLNARALSRTIESELGQPMPVVNRTGANGGVGSASVANAQPNGQTLLLGPGTLFTISPLFFNNMPVRLDELRVILGLAQVPFFMAVRADSPWETLEDHINDAKSGTEISYGHSGTGGSDFTLRALYNLAEVQATGVPYGGGSESITALLSGDVDAVSQHPGELIEQVEGGEMRFLTNFSPERFERIPDVPTAMELGYDLTVDQYRYLAGPVDLPDEIAATIEENARAATNTEEYQQYLQDEMVGEWTVDGDEVTDTLLSERERYRDLIEEFDIDTDVDQ